MKIFLFLLSIGPWPLSPLHALVLQGQGYGGRAVGMAEAVTGDSLGSPFSLYYNPAQLPLARNAEFSMDYAQLLMGLSDHSQISQSFLGFVYPWQTFGGPRFAAAFGYTDFVLRSIYQEQAWYASYGRTMAWRPAGGILHGGASVKFMSRRYTDQDNFANARYNSGAASGRPDPVFADGRSKSAFSLDWGAHWQHPSGWSLGGRLADFNEPNLALGPNTDRLHRSLKLGVFYRKSPALGLGADVEFKKRLSSVTDRRMGFALEREITAASLGSFAFRGGYGFGSRSWKMLFLGFSWRSNALGVDYAFQLPLAFASVAGNHRLTLSLRFGQPSPEDETAKLYRQERRARARAQEELDWALEELGKLLAAAEKRKEEEDAVAIEPVKMEEKPAVQAPQKPEGPAQDFWTAWKLYKERSAAGAFRAERLKIVRRILDVYGRWEPALSEWASLESALQQDRREFGLIWKSYQQLTSMGADIALRLQTLKRIVSRFEGSGIDMNAVYRELDRLK